MNTKTEMNCPSCNQRIRIPAGKHIKFVCPNCSKEFEIDNRIKETGKKSNYNWILSAIIGGLMFFGYKYYTNHKDKNIETNHIVNSENAGGDIVSNKEQFDRNLTALIKAVDVSNETTNDFAVRLASKFPGEYNIGQICQIYDYIVRNWKYVNDSDKMENFRSASRSIKNNLSGDCDDFAILIAALIESIGGDARISFAYNDEGGHAFTEVLATNSKTDMQAIVDEINTLYGTNQFKIHYFEDADGRCWLNLDWFGQPQHPGGQYFNYNKRTIYYPTIEKPTYTQE